MESQITFFREVLARELRLRTVRNPAYSLRAFARDMGMPASKLSELFNGKKGLSPSSAKKIIQTLKLNPKEAQLFLASLNHSHGRSQAVRAAASRNLSELREGARVAELDLDRFHILSEWWHFAILELTELKDFDSNPAAIAKRLGLTTKVVKDAIERLLDFGLLENHKGVLKQTNRDLAVPGGAPSQAIRQYHTQIIQKAMHSLETVPVEEREIGSLTFSMDSEDLPRAMTTLRRLRRLFAKRMQSKRNKDRLYCLNVNFFPLDSKENP